MEHAEKGRLKNEQTAETSWSTRRPFEKEETRRLIDLCGQHRRQPRGLRPPNLRKIYTLFSDRHLNRFASKTVLVSSREQLSLRKGEGVADTIT